MAGTLPTSIQDPVFSGLAIGYGPKYHDLVSRGFGMAEVQSHHVVRFEFADSARTYFIELAADQGDQIVAEGWILERNGEELYSEARAQMSALSAAYGIPDDLIAESGVRAVGWIDSLQGLRLELLQQAKDGDAPGQLSLVLRRP